MMANEKNVRVGNQSKGICLHYFFSDDEAPIEFAKAKEAYWRGKTCELLEQIEMMEAQLKLMRVDHQEASATWNNWEREIKLLNGELD